MLLKYAQDITVGTNQYEEFLSLQGEIVDAMTECERSPTLRARLREDGFVAAAKLGSSILAAACLNAYRRAVNGSHTPK